MEYIICLIIGYFIGKNIKWILNELKYFWELRKEKIKKGIDK